MRTASSNWLGKVIMAVVVGFLVISFAIWGIGDIFSGFGRSTLAKIGGTEITIESFRQLYNERLQQLSRQIGRPISLDQARMLGFDRQVIGQLVAEVALDERVRALGLNISDADVAHRVTSDPTFQGPNGRFDRARFEQVIRQAGYTEPRFVAEQRRQLLRRQLVGTVVSGPNVPKAAVEAVHRYQNEQRSIEYVLLDRAQAGDIPPPSPEALAKYFEERKILFRAPEYRKVVVLPLIPAQQAQWIEVSDADLKRAYEERRARYVTPERRQIRQIVFPTAEEAGAAADRIAKGAGFTAIAAERGLTAKDIELGTLAKAAMIDRAIAEAAFSLKPGEVSAPVQGRFGTALVEVVKIEPEQVRSFQEVAAEIKRDIATERARAELLTIYDKIEDERSLGKTLAEAAEKLKLPSRTVEIDRSGRDPSGRPVADMPDAQRLITAVFATDVGIENDPLQVDGGYVWYEVTGVTPAHDRTLDAVRDRVEARWREDEIAKRLKTKANQIMDEIKGGKTFAEVVAAQRLKLETKNNIKRADAAIPLSARAVDTVFRAAKGALGSADAEQPAAQVVFRVTNIVVPKLDMNSEDAKRIRETLSGALSEVIGAEYIARVESEIGVSINQSALIQVISGRSNIDR